MPYVETRILAKGRKSGDDRSPEMNEFMEMLVAQGFPPYTEMARRGNGWSVIQTTATAGLVVRPSTVAAITIFNNEPVGGKSYIVDRIFSHALVAGGEQGYGSLWACVHPAGMTKPTADIAGSAVNLVGDYGRTYAGTAVVDVGATVVDNGWFPWGTCALPPTALPGSAISVDVAGRLIVPPTAALSLQVVTSVNDETYCSGAHWFEEQLTLGT
jgi:hypothetical protein